MRQKLVLITVGLLMTSGFVGSSASGNEIEFSDDSIAVTSYDGCGCCDCGDSCDCGSGCDCVGCGDGVSGGLLGFGLLGGGWANDFDSPLSVWLYGGPTYTGGNVDLFGFSEGVVLGYRITDSIGFYGAAGFNHTDDSTQFLGTLGFQRFGNARGETIVDRTTVWALWDQFDDDSVGTTHGQFRYNIGYVPKNMEGTEIGVSYSVSADNNQSGAQVPVGGSRFSTSSGGYVGPYVSTPFRESQVYASVGHAEDTDSAVAGFGITTPVSDSDRTNLYLDTKFGEDDDSSVSFGVAYGFGAADTTEYGRGKRR